MEPLTVPIEIDLEAVAERVAEILAERTPAAMPEQGPRWLYGAEKASEYLGVPIGQVQKLTAANVMPHRKLGGRNLYRTDELDAWLDGYYGVPARGLPALRAVP